MKKVLKIISAVSFLSVLLIIQNCSNDDAGPSPIVLETITNLIVTDMGNNGNGTDLQVSFTKVADESNVAEYRIFVIKSTNSSGFNLANALSIPASNLFVVNKTGSNISVNLAANSKTINGELIANNIAYKIFVMTVSNIVQEFNITEILSTASPEITLVDDSAPTPLQAVSNLQIEDVGFAGNGTDLQVAFSKVSDESNVAEYRIFVVNSASSANFDLAMAESVATENLFVVDNTGANISVQLASNSKTTTGELITNDNLYKVFVMTVSNDSAINTNTLSTPSAEFSLRNNVKVTYIANDGVMLEFEDKKVMIDGMNRASNLAGAWVSPSAADYLNVENGVAPYDDIDVIMVTHAHGDHINTPAIQNYLTNHPNTKLIVPSSMQVNFAGFASQMPNFSINKFERVNLNVNNISIDVLEIEHFDQNNQDFSMVQSYAYIVTLNGKKLFHTGDIDYIDSQLNVFNLLADNIDVIFIPTFVIPGLPNQNLVTTQNRDAIINNVNPDTIICMHFLLSTMSQSLTDVSNVYTNAVTFTTPFETVEY